VKNIKNFTIENSINKNYFKDNLYSKDKIKLNKIIKNVYTDLNEVKNTFHILSKKFNLEFKKSNLKKFNKYQTVVLIGMGGSVLGTQAIYTFLKQGIKKNLYFLII
jgi:glucose-6-phosphate isomerase